MFIDADKPSNPQYVEWAVRLARLSATAIQTVGTKGHDGFALALVLPRGEPAR